MCEELVRVARRHRSPWWVIATLVICAAALLAGGAAVAWYQWSTGLTAAGSTIGASFVVAGLGFGGDAGRRIAINRVIDEMLRTIT